MGLAIFVIIQMLRSPSKLGKNGRTVSIMLKVLLTILVIGTIALSLPSLSITDLLAESNRSTLVVDAIPCWIRSGRILEGLGYISTVAYGGNLTPYVTYWLDNSYIYYLVATGVAGFSIFVTTIALIWRGVVRESRYDAWRGDKIIAFLYSYMFIGLFEAAMLAPGVISNYFLLPVVFAFMSSGGALVRGDSTNERTYNENRNHDLPCIL